MPTKTTPQKLAKITYKSTPTTIIASIYKHIIENDFSLAIDYATELGEIVASKLTWKNIYKTIYNSFKNDERPQGVRKYLVEHFASRNEVIDAILACEKKLDKTSLESNIDYLRFLAKEEKLDNTFRKLKDDIALADTDKAVDHLAEIKAMMIKDEVLEVDEETQWAEVAEEADNSISEGTTTGSAMLNKMSDGGYRRGHLWGIAARTGGGKSFFICQMYLWWRKFGKKGQKFIILSNEMKRHEILLRVLSMDLNLTLSETEKEILDDTERFRKAREKINESLKVYENCFDINQCIEIMRRESNKGNWLIALDHYHNLAQQKREEGEDQQYKSHYLQEMVFRYKICLLTGYQIPKLDYKSDTEVTIKGRADAMETSNYIIALVQKENEENSSIKITKVITLKSRRGQKVGFELKQDFSKSGLYIPIA